MNRFALVYVCALILGIMFKGMAGEGAPDAAMAAAMEKMKPGKEHEGLKKLEGVYDVAVKMFMEAGKPPVESKGAAEFKMTMNGRWLKQEYKGEMMGQPFTGTGYDGYDRVTGKYVGVWMDDFSTQMMHSVGTSKDGGKTIEYTGEQGDCMQEGKIVKTKQVHKTVSDDQFIFEMYHTADGKEIKDMELVYTRKK